MSTRQGFSKRGSRKRIWLVALCGFALALAAAPAARADAITDLFDAEAFTPHFQVCTSGSPCEMSSVGVDLDGNLINNYDPIQDQLLPLSYATSTLQAGAHPVLALKIAMEQPDHCLDWELTNRSGICTPDKVYMEQILKKLAMHLPPGLVADANAAPYCDPYQQWMPGKTTEEHFLWTCGNPDAFVGTGIIYASQCVKDSLTQIHCYGDYGLGLATALRVFLYNDRPRTTGSYAGEQGHLVMMVANGLPVANRLNPHGWAKIDIGITTRGDLSLDSIADPLPDPIVDIPRGIGVSCDPFIEPPSGCPRYLGLSQEYEILLLLNGAVGEAQGHPLLTNPTFCDPQTIDTQLQGYAHNSISDITSEIVRPASGDGKTVTDSLPYQATGCDSVPYDPKLSLSLDTTAPDKPAAISTTITQADGEATTKKTEVTFPSTFKINAQNKATFCSDADLTASNCPESSRIGTATASSRLLPIGQTLTGNVYLTGLTGDSVKISILLSGFVNLRVDGAGKISSDGSLVTTFDNQPSAPLSEFKLSLEGGDKGLLKTPKVCAPQTVTSTFTSHSGKTSTISSPIDITGCQAPTLSATLTSRKPGAPTNLELDIHSLGTKLKSVTFIPARQLHWGIPGHGRAQSAKAKATSVGKVAFTTAQGELATAFKAARTPNNGIDLVAIGSRGAQGTVSELSGFTANLSRTKTGSPLKRKARRRSKQAVPQSHLALNGLPQNDLTGIDLTLNNKRKRFTLRNPLGCKHPLNFVALATAVDGTQFAVSDRVKLMGKGC